LAAISHERRVDGFHRLFAFGGIDDNGNLDFAGSIRGQVWLSVGRWKLNVECSPGISPSAHGCGKSNLCFIRNFASTLANPLRGWTAPSSALGIFCNQNGTINSGTNFFVVHRIKNHIRFFPNSGRNRIGRAACPVRYQPPTEPFEPGRMKKKTNKKQQRRTV